MTTRIIKTDQERKAVIRLIENRALPFTVKILKDATQRTWKQNKLQRKWLLEAEEQLGEYTAEEYRAYCKLTIGVPILRAEDEEFCKKYDEVIRPLSYQHKLKCMMVPLDFPITRLMNTKQKTKYLDAMYEHFTSLGCELTRPNE